jgi:hypothetical protein
LKELVFAPTHTILRYTMTPSGSQPGNISNSTDRMPLSLSSDLLSAQWTIEMSDGQTLRKIGSGAGSSKIGVIEGEAYFLPTSRRDLKVIFMGPNSEVTDPVLLLLEPGYEAECRAGKIRVESVRFVELPGRPSEAAIEITLCYLGDGWLQRAEAVLLGPDGERVPSDLSKGVTLEIDGIKRTGLRLYFPRPESVSGFTIQVDSLFVRPKHGHIVFETGE